MGTTGNERGSRIFLPGSAIGPSPHVGTFRLDPASREIYSHRIDSPIGPLLIGATATAVCMVEFLDTDRASSQLAALCGLLGATDRPGRNGPIDQVIKELEAYFAGTRRGFDCALTYPGTAFQQTVWRALTDIPYGETVSYETLAQRVGRPTGQRAVGLANGRNRIAILIPCHRVINKSGELGGYGGGLDRKRFLLDLERKSVGSPSGNGAALRA